MNGILGLNTRTIGVSRDMIMSAARQIGGAWILCHNDPDLVREANAAGFKTIYRQSADESLDMDAATFARTRLDKGATLAHSYNEITSQPKLHANTKTALTLGKQLIYNYGTHAPRSAWEDGIENIRAAAATGQGIGIHFYPDTVNDSTLKEWLSIKRAVGGLWIVTEFGYLRDFRNPYKGWRGVMNAGQRAAFLDTWMPFFNAENMPVCEFCFDPWDQPTVEAAKADGLGFWDYADTISHMAVLNRTFTWSEKPVTQPYPDGANPAPKVINQTVGLKLRATPNGAQLGIMPYKAPVIVYAQPVENANGYAWQRVEWNTLKGWAAAVVGGVSSFVDASAPKLSLHAPFKHYLTTSHFNDPRDYSKIAPTRIQKHEGTDFVDELTLDYGSDPMVHVCAPGTVREVGYDAAGYGNYVVVAHADGFSTLYGHMAEVYVKQGEYLPDWKILGLAGSTGHSSGVHLHLNLCHPTLGANNYVYPAVLDAEQYIAVAASVTLTAA